MNTNKSVSKNVAKNAPKLVASPAVKKLEKSTVKLVKSFTDDKSFFELCSGTDYSEMFDIFAHFPKLAKSIKNKSHIVKVLMASANSGAGKNELLMLSENGATIEEMRANRGAVESHLNSLKKAGYTVTRNKETKRYHITL